jgi:hypothetical protein
MSSQSSTTFPSQSRLRHTHQSFRRQLTRLRELRVIP